MCSLADTLPQYCVIVKFYLDVLIKMSYKKPYLAKTKNLTLFDFH